MKILCVIDSLGSGGAQRQLVTLAVGFKEKGHEVSFLVYYRDNFFKKLLDENNIPVYESIEPNYLKRLLKMRRFIRRGDFNAVLSFLESANFICEVAGLPWRKWSLVVGERSANPNVLKSFKLRAYRWFHCLADYVVSNSHENIKIVRRINPFLSKRKCKVIYNIVDFKKWRPAEDYQPLKDGKLHLIVVSSHQYLKNLSGLVEALHLFTPNERRMLRIDWYGGKSNDDSKIIAEKKIKQYGLYEIINFYDPILSIEEKVKKADVIGLFSFYEGLPNSVCEGMACGKPIVATKVSDMPSLIKDGVNGFLAENGNPESIKSVLQKILTCSTSRLLNFGIESNKKAHILFNKDHIISSYLKLLIDQ